VAEVREIAGRIWKWVLLGIGVGALYSNATGIIPVAEAMLKGGGSVGTKLALMMSVVALTLPEMLIFRSDRP
jgi:hypothetical protein